ncbi:MAG TPA: Spy/CpxP family protein refolding chaperone [Terriglobales bacterium]|nr:Spy/CpxP family protein refolding chaperone [Terriglobales bacterium]
MKLASVLIGLALAAPLMAAQQGPSPAAKPAPAATPAPEWHPRARTPAPPEPPGQPHPHGLGKWWKDSKVAAELQLSEAQIKQIEQTFLEHRLKLIDLRANLEREETKLQPLIEADQPDEAQVGAQVDRLVAARGQLEKANTMMMLAIRKVLTVEQWKKLQSIKGERDRVFFFHAAPAPAVMSLPPGEMEFEEPL